MHFIGDILVMYIVFISCSFSTKCINCFN